MSAATVDTATVDTTIMDTTVVDTAVVEAALGEVYDPCSQAWQRPVSLRDLGLVRRVRVDGDGRVSVTLSLTVPFCVGLATIMRAVEARLGALPAVTEVVVDIDTDTPWSTDLMTERGRAALAARRDADRARALPSLVPKTVLVPKTSHPTVLVPSLDQDQDEESAHVRHHRVG